MLKRSAFLVITCLLFGALSTQLSAQSETGWSTSFFYTQVYCDGEVLGWAYGVMDYHYAAHYNADGEQTSILYMAKGEAECNFSDEKFTYKEKGQVRWDKEIQDYVLHLKGDQGSRYMMHISIDWDTGEWIFGPANCK